MNYIIIFSSSVEAEIQQSYDWYEEQKSNLGERFLNIIESSIQAISKYPEAFPLKLGTFREYVVPKFPYVIVYELIPEKGLIYILHVFNTYLNPNRKREV
ncbi:type II toxin-antitoxin system RelE/ParE family toxin [Pedobacter fastidiosus]|uniref:Type II toxin-antitoxin system RelE/ParE family toxin n=1 Tax=Pedobacter fastidiosus TaxID=2765361 RepID=A0ABR7KNP7_9SPHI|nr:type II toxin-antitoxin system RelE/ParE family toxin [Pedobacter fastidiosus]MBC6109701.1 type II toxin-antitoxin system RelE/ParE family toxin [Pedobacter fastidiosus]